MSISADSSAKLRHTSRPNDVDRDRLLTPAQTAQLLVASISWLAKARLSGEGPRFVKIGRSVRYPESYVRDFIRLRTRSSTSE